MSSGLTDLGGILVLLPKLQRGGGLIDSAEIVAGIPTQRRQDM